MRISTWVKVIGCVLLLGGCNSSDDSPPVAGGGGTGSADSFTNSVAQAANGQSDTEEPSEQLAQLDPSTPENPEPANL